MRGLLKSHFVRAAVLTSGLLLGHGTAATTLNFDFDSGLPTGFSILNDGGLFSVGTSGGALSITKSADTGGTTPIRGGIESDFEFDGDFSVTIDFSLNLFPFAGNSQFNDAVLQLTGAGGATYSMQRFRLQAGLQSLDLLQAFGNPPGFPLGLQAASALSGSYRLSRAGSVMTAEFRANGASFFVVDSGSVNLTGPLSLSLFGSQRANGFGRPRSATALDITYDNLTITAATISTAPEPVTAMLLVSGVGLAVGLRRRGRRAAVVSANALG